MTQKRHQQQAVQWPPMMPTPWSPEPASSLDDVAQWNGRCTWFQGHSPADLDMVGWSWGASLRLRKGASREREGGLQCLGAKFSSALFWVTTFTMFLHPESFRLPARLRCFQLMGSHAYLTTGLVQGLPSSLTAALQSPHCSAGCPSLWGGQVAKFGAPHGS